MAAIQLEIVTPERRVLSQEVDEVRAPGATGSFGVRAGHTAFVAQLRAGRLDAVTSAGTESFAVGEGFVQVALDKVLVLAASAERAEEIDLAQAQATAEAESKKLLAMKAGEEGYELQRARVEREAARVLVASKRE